MGYATLQCENVILNFIKCVMLVFNSLCDNEIWLCVWIFCLFFCVLIPCNHYDSIERDIDIYPPRHKYWGIVCQGPLYLTNSSEATTPSTPLWYWYGECILHIHIHTHIYVCVFSLAIFGTMHFVNWCKQLCMAHGVSDRKIMLQKGRLLCDVASEVASEVADDTKCQGWFQFQEYPKM